MAPKLKVQSKKAKIALIVVGILVVLMLLLSILPRVLWGNKIALTADQVTVVQEGRVDKRVSVSGALAADKETTLSTTLQGPVAEVDVKPGDRVNENQLLARIDVTDVRDQLQKQQADQASAQLAADQAVSKAQAENAQLADAMKRGLNGEINQAQSAVEEAEANLAIAQRNEDRIRGLRDTGEHPEIELQRQAVEQARTGLLQALLGFQENPTGAIVAVEGLDQAETTYINNLRKVDQDLAEASDATAKAFRAKADAIKNLETAKLAAANQLRNGQTAVADAQATAEASRNSNALANQQLQKQIDSSEVVAPHAGIVTKVQAQPGKPAAEGLVTIADDSRIVLRTSVRESDVANIKPGAEVVFTTVPTGKKEFKGKVTVVSPVAIEQQSSTDPNAANNDKKSLSGFPIEIEVTGDRSGLLIGSKAKAKIITEASPKGLLVPTDALVDDNHVLVAVGDGPSKRLEMREVKTGMRNEFQVVITGGELKKGDTVVNRGAEYAGQVGQEVNLG